MTLRTAIGFVILLSLLAWSWFRLLRLVFRIERQKREVERAIETQRDVEVQL